MQEQQLQQQPSPRQVPRTVIAGIAGIIALAVGGSVLWGWHLLVTSNAPLDRTIFPNERLEDRTSGEVVTSDGVETYWLSGEGEQVAFVPRPVTIESAARPQEMIEAALTRLLAGSNEEDLTTTIPPETTLLGVRLGPEGIYVDLSSDFEAGGESEAMVSRLGQVLYTATSLNPDANVWFEVDGKPLEVLGEEEIRVNQPMTRDLFEANF